MIRSLGAHALACALGSLLVGAPGCGGSKDPPAKTAGATADAKTPAPAAGVAAGDADPADDTDRADDAKAAADAQPGAQEKATDDTGGAGEAKAAADAEAGGEGKAAAEGDSETPADPKALLTEVQTKKTTDERALAALVEAETAGAKPRELAKAAVARGQKLHDAPDRAKPFFEWAAAKDSKYPDPLFHLAKQAAIVGEIDEAKAYLVQVHARGGKKLLAQIEFDPMWEILKDDPDIKKLLQ